MLSYSRPFSVTGGDPASAAGVLPVSIRHQSMRNWCWAAVAELVSALLDIPPQSQCQIASQALGGVPCCPCPPCNAQCDTTHTLQDALGAHFGSVIGSPTYPPSGAVVDFDTISHEINNNRRPVCCEIDFSGLSEHYVAIIGAFVIASVAYVRVCDPLSGDGNYQDIPFQQFAQAYNGGSWDSVVTVA